MQTDPLPDTEQSTLKWYQHKPVQVMFSVGVFMFFSAIIFVLAGLYSKLMTAYRNANMISVVSISHWNLLGASNSLKADTPSFNASERKRSNELSQHLENAAGEVANTQQFLLKSAAQSAPVWLQIAFNQLSQREVVGAENNPQILKYLNSIELKASYYKPTDEIPWAVHFVNWVIKHAKMTGMDSDQSRSWLNWGEPMEKPEPGAVAVFKLEQHPQGGYVGFFLSETPSYVIVLGGDIGNAVRIIAMKKADLLGYRWPKEAQKPPHPVVVDHGAK